MKNLLFTLILLVLTSCSFAQNKTALKQWEATPDGVYFKKWEASVNGKKVQASANKINTYIRANKSMNAVVTSLTLPQGAKLGFGVMVKIDGEELILAFGPESNNEFSQLRGLKVNDKIEVKSKGVTKAPKYAYPIVNGNYVARDGKIIFKALPNKGGC